MNIPYEMFLTIQLMHFTCRKYRVQSPTRKQGWDLFQRTSDDNSRNMNLKLLGSETPWQKKELQRAVDPPWRMKNTMGIRDNSRWRKECYDQRITVEKEVYDVYDMILRHKGKYVVPYGSTRTSVQSKGSWFASERIDYDMTYSIHKYISSIEPHVQNEEGRWYSTSGGVTTEDI